LLCLLLSMRFCGKPDHMIISGHASSSYSDISSPAMVLRLMLHRPLFTQASVRAHTCTSTVDITHLQAERSSFKRNVQYLFHATFGSTGSREQTARLIGIGSSMSVSVLEAAPLLALVPVSASMLESAPVLALESVSGVLNYANDDTVQESTAPSRRGCSANPHARPRTMDHETAAPNNPDGQWTRDTECTAPLIWDRSTAATDRNPTRVWSKPLLEY
jgi:hypothetical protein